MLFEFLQIPKAFFHGLIVNFYGFDLNRCGGCMYIGHQTMHLQGPRCWRKL